MGTANNITTQPPAPLRLDWPTVVKLAAAGGLFLLILLLPMPAGLTGAGQRALAVMALAVVLWATEALPPPVTGILGIVLLTLLGAVPDLAAGLYGFSQPVTYFLLGILTIGLAVQRSGLAQRLATLLIRSAVGKPRYLYAQMLLSFAALTFALPSASTRGAIMVHVYEQVLARWDIPRGHRYHKTLMLALGSLNRLGSTALLTGGVTPVVASGLIGDFSWTQWFLLMSLPFYALLLAGGAILYLLYRSGFNLERRDDLARMSTGAMAPAEYRAGAIVLLTALLWFTDFIHGLHPAAPALLALTLILLPRMGILSWQEFERDVGWSNIFIIAASLSLANALVTTGAAAWFAEGLVAQVNPFQDRPLLVLLFLCAGFALARMLMTNIAGYLAVVIPVTMAGAVPLGLDPLLCALAAVVIGDTPVFFGAGGTSAVFIYQRAGIANPEILRFGLIMTVVAVAVLFLVALPWWGLLGHSLAG